jgi:hypothetical protein
MSSDREQGRSGPRVLYIAGYGRSGSTLLSAILSGHPEVFSAGELAFLPEDWTLPGRVCSCGERYSECPFWSGLESHVGRFDEWSRTTRAVEKWIRVRPVSRSARHAYGRVWRTVLEWSADKAGATIVVDSSKTAWATLRRPAALKALARADVAAVHLVRDSYATLGSVTRTGSNWELEGRSEPRPFRAVRSLAGWVVANLGAMLLGRVLGRERYLRVRYEDLLADPARWIERIGMLLDTPLDDLGSRAADGEAFAISHVAGGNRMRFGGEVRLEARAGKPCGLGLRHRVLCMVAAGWLRRVYGYGRPR